MLPFHPAPNTRGIGKFMPAVWSIPENPIMRAYGLGQIVDGIYTLPQNPIVMEILAKRKMAEELQKNPLGPVGLSCGPSTCACQVGLCGLGVTVDEVLKDVTSGGWQTWAIAGAGVLALVLLTGGGGSQRRSEIAAARAQYKAKVASIKAARPRRYQKFV